MPPPTAPTSTAPPIPYQALWERSAGLLACRLVIAAVRLAPDEYAGMVAGYVGTGDPLLEPFHVRFDEHQAVHLAIGDHGAVPRGACLFEHWPRPARLAAAQARLALRRVIVETAEGFWTAADAERSQVCWLRHDTGSARSGRGALDERVWSTVSAHSGSPAGLES